MVKFLLFYIYPLVCFFIQQPRGKSSDEIKKTACVIEPMSTTIPAVQQTGHFISILQKTHGTTREPGGEQMKAVKISSTGYFPDIEKPMAIEVVTDTTVPASELPNGDVRKLFDLADRRKNRLSMKEFDSVTNTKRDTILLNTDTINVDEPITFSTIFIYRKLEKNQNQF